MVGRGFERPLGVCEGCDGAGCDPRVAGEPEGALEGIRLAGWSAAIFLMPLVTMAAGAALGGPGGAGQVAGALIGGVLGVLMARAGLWWGWRTRATHLGSR